MRWLKISGFGFILGPAFLWAWRSISINDPRRIEISSAALFFGITLVFMQYWVITLHERWSEMHKAWTCMLILVMNIWGTHAVWLPLYVGWNKEFLAWQGRLVFMVPAIYQIVVAITLLTVRSRGPSS